MGRRIWAWTDLQLDKLNKVQEILRELDEYKPLTLRQIYYQLVGKGYIENNVSQYGMLSGLLKWARIDGRISWDEVEDRTRTYHNAHGWQNKDAFISREIDIFLEGYRRDLMLSQEKYIEIWIEKDALASIFTKVARPYCISVVVCKGFASVSFLNDFKARVMRSGQGRKIVMLYFGDFDPSGMEMLKAMKTTLETEMKIEGIEYKRVALMKDDIRKYKLPHNPDAIKKKDSRAENHVRQYGDLAVELDALSPAILVQKIEAAILEEIDIEEFEDEQETYTEELDLINELKENTRRYITDSWRR